MKNVKTTAKFMMCATVAMAAASLAGCQSSGTETAQADSGTMLASGPVNTMCPIGGHEANPEIGTVTYKGAEIAFCCEGCLDAWPDLSVEDRDTYLQAALDQK